MHAETLQFVSGIECTVECETENQIKILIIDDNRDFANSIYSLLRHLKYRTFVAYDEEQAMEKIKRIKPDLVFCDFGLPNKGAYRIAYKVRTNFALNHIFLVGLTTATQDRFRLIAMETGFDSSISKPIHTSILSDILNKVEERKLAQT